MEDRLLPMQPVPLSILLTDPKEQQGCYSFVPTGSQELPERSWGQHRAALGVPTPDFSSRFTPEAFFMTGYCCKAVEVLSQSFLLLDEQPSQGDDPDLPKVSGYEVPETRDKDTYLHMPILKHHCGILYFVLQGKPCQ